MRPFGHRVLNAAQGLLSNCCHNVALRPVTRQPLHTKSISNLTNSLYSTRKTQQFVRSPILSRCFSTPSDDGKDKDKKPETSATEQTTFSTTDSSSESAVEPPPVPPKSEKRSSIYGDNRPLTEVFNNLPSQIEQRRSTLSKRFSKTMDELHVAVFTAGRRLNDLTGYSEIEVLKRSIEEQGAWDK
jgi:hypothetical protein